MEFRTWFSGGVFISDGLRGNCLTSRLFSCKALLSAHCHACVHIMQGLLIIMACMLCLQDNLLYTLTVQCPQSRWPEDGEKLKAAAATLRLKPSGVTQFPGGLR